MVSVSMPFTEYNSICKPFIATLVSLIFNSTIHHCSLVIIFIWGENDFVLLKIENWKFQMQPDHSNALRNKNANGSIIYSIILNFLFQVRTSKPSIFDAITCAKFFVQLNVAEYQKIKTNGVPMEFFSSHFGWHSKSFAHTIQVVKCAWWNEWKEKKRWDVNSFLLFFSG